MACRGQHKAAEVRCETYQCKRIDWGKLILVGKDCTSGHLKIQEFQHNRKVLKVPGYPLLSFPLLLSISVGFNCDS